MSTKLRARVVILVTTVALSGAAAVVPIAVVADHTTAHTIEQLQAQIAALQAQLAALSGGQKAPAAKCNFTRDLTVGARGDDVKCLQDYLTGTGHFTYAGGSTGFFGPITKSAVAAWQAANGVSPAAGYFGPISRAKYESLVASMPAPTPGPGPAPAGTGLTVIAPAAQPAATLAPKGAARVPFVRAVLTASADGDITVKSITVERQGLADDAAFSGVVLIDEDGTQIGLEKTLSSTHRAVLTGPFVVKAGTSKTVTVAGNMASSLTNQAGQVAKLAIVAVDAGNAQVNASLPIVGNGMTMNDTLSIGTVTMSRGVTDPGAANTKEVGTKGYVFAAVRATAGSAEDVVLESIRWDQAGSAAASDLANVKVLVDSAEYSVTTDGKFYTAKFGEGVTIPKGGVKEIAIRGDIESGSDRTIDFNILRKTDIVVRGKTFGYYITPSGGSSGSASEGSFSSDSEPFYNAYAATISKGTLRVEKDNSVPAGKVAVDVANTPLGAFLFEAKGEPVQVTKVVLKFTGSTTPNLSDVGIYDANGALVAGPKDVSGASSATYTDTFTVPIGKYVYTVKGKLTSGKGWATNDTIGVSIDPDSDMTAKGEVTGLSITPTPSSAVDANTQTVKAAALTISVAPTPAAQNVVRGVNGFHFATYQFDATDSGEDLRVTSFKVRDTLSAPSVGDEVNTCQMFDGATVLNTDVVNPTDPSSTTNDVTFTFDTHLIVPKGTVKNVDLKCNVSANATANSTHAWGLASGTSDAAVTGKNTGSSVTETITTGTGQTMTIKTAGSMTISLDSSSPAERLAIAGKTDVLLTVLKLHANDEAIKLDRIALVLSSSTASTTDITKVTLWDGATKVGEAVFTGSNTRATSTLTGDFIIPKDGDKLLSIKADLAMLGTNQPAVRGRLIAVNYDGEATTTTRGIGQSSGTAINPSQGANTAGKGVRLVKSMPTLERLALQTNTLIDGTLDLYRFKVTADAAGDVGLYRFTFKIATSGFDTVNNLNIYAYSDSGFSVNAYNSNPVTKDSRGNVTATSSSALPFYFNPDGGGSGKEALQVPAGSSRYFKLVGQVSGTGSGDSVSVQLEGDADVPVDTNTVGRETANTVDTAAMHSQFIWSPNTTTTAATTTDDWMNGYLVPGLPNDNMQAQTLSR